MSFSHIPCFDIMEKIGTLVIRERKNILYNRHHRYYMKHICDIIEGKVPMYKSYRITCEPLQSDPQYFWYAQDLSEEEWGYDIIPRVTTPPYINKTYIWHIWDCICDAYDIDEMREHMFIESDDEDGEEQPSTKDIQRSLYCPGFHNLVYAKRR
jgi:hypothetical protein